MHELELEHLVGRGYFPKELPPCFTTKQFARFVGENESFRDAISRFNGQRDSLTYGLTLPGPWVRDLAIIHPVPQVILANEIVNAKDVIASRIDEAHLSLSKPSRSDRRAVKPSVSGAQIRQRRLRVQRSARYYLKCDVAACYHSIYTHSIPWALHGKEVGKANHSDDFVGNRLDRAVRYGMHGQTSGLPVGPDTSLILAELVLSAVDQEFQERFGEVRGFRFMDDYFLVFEERSKAEKALNDLTSALRKYELRLNSKKTELGRVPASIEKAWVTELRTNFFQRGPFDQQSLETYFSLIIDLKKRFPDELVFRYALGQLNSVFPRWRRLDYRPVQDFLALAVRAEVGCLPTVLQLVQKLQRTSDLPGIVKPAGIGQTVDFELIKTVLAKHAIWAARAGFEHEVLWCLWGFFHLNLDAPDRMVETLRDFDHPLVKLLLFWGRDEGLLNDPLDIHTVQDPEEALEGSNWLINYEGAVRGWIAPDDVQVDNHEVFGQLSGEDIRFLDFTIPDSGEGVVQENRDERDGEFMTY